jgi:hypothetical protein
MAEISENTKEKSKSMLSLFNRANDVDKLKPTATSSDILNGIYRLMVQIDTDNKIDQQMRFNKREEEITEQNRRHDEIISALTTKKPEIPKKEKEKVPSKNDGKKAAEKILKDKKVEPKIDKGVQPKVPDKLPKEQTGVLSNFPTVPKTIGKPAATTGAGTTAAKIGTGVAITGLGAAGISIFGETGAKNPSQAMKKGGQIVPNDPEPGHFSYGIFGMNTKSGTIHKFAAQNPQFGLTSKPGTKSFDDQWKELAEKRPKELYEAQLKWHQENIINPLKKDLSNLPAQIANDSRVLAYLADRRVQYGGVMEKQALSYSSTAKDGTEFINMMTEFDLANIGKAFKTALSNNPGIELGLRNRVERRRMLAMQIESETGTKLNQSSTENKNLRDSLEKDLPAPQRVNNTNINSSDSKQVDSKKQEDDRSAYERKKNIR